MRITILLVLTLIDWGWRLLPISFITPKKGKLGEFD